MTFVMSPPKPNETVKPASDPSGPEGVETTTESDDTEVGSSVSDRDLKRMASSGDG